jgi:hypothetical protein
MTKAPIFQILYESQIMADEPTRPIILPLRDELVSVLAPEIIISYYTAMIDFDVVACLDIQRWLAI